MILPSTEIADVARPPDVGRPTALDVHDGIVEANREEDGPLLSPLLLHRSLDFLLHPRATDRMLREHQ